MNRIGGWLTCERVAYASAVSSLAIGLTFIFVWAPHPWGHEGIDKYHELGLALARGDGLRTLIVPWGYPAFLALFYRVFGDRPVVPLVVQAALSATIPVMLFRQSAPRIGRRAAAIAAALTGLLSFNTVYASTQASDSVCNVMFVAAILLFTEAELRGDVRWYAASGALTTAAAQFRPNLILVPFVLALFAYRHARAREAFERPFAVFAAAALVLAPWTVRNYVRTGQLIPASAHGGTQLWYGSLQTGPYLESRAYNPRFIFEHPTFPSSSLVNVPLHVRASVRACAEMQPDIAELVYWSDRVPLPKRMPPTRHTVGRLEFDVPPPPAPAVFYYYFDTRWPTRDHPTYRTTPPSGDETPYVFFVSTDHLGDLDVHGDVLDVFDLLRMARHLAWGEPLPWADRLDLNRDDRIDAGDLREMVAWLSTVSDEHVPSNEDRVVSLDVRPDHLTIEFRDKSTINLPRSARSLTDIRFSEGVADAVLHTTRPFRRIAAGEQRAASPADACRALASPSVNADFDRAEPHMMRRHVALAWDNIRRDPLAYLESCAYRAVRIFVIAGSSDDQTAQQFAGSGRIYRAGRIATVVYLTLFAAGVVVAVVRRLDIGLFLALIAYIPATICFVLINMRYSVTVQPYMFLFVAVAIEALLAPRARGSMEKPAAARSRTAPLP